MLKEFQIRSLCHPLKLNPSMLLDKLLENKIAWAIYILRESEPPEGFFVAFSGGKDSIVIYDLCLKAKVNFQSYFNRTSVDPPELLTYIKQYYPDTIFLRPKYTMFQLILKKKMLPMRNKRFCCEYLKEYSGKRRIVVTGIRAEESLKRAERPQIDIKKRKNSKSFIHPIFYWTELDVWEYIEQNGLTYCPLYDDSDCHRIGCIGCPCQNRRLRLNQFRRYPNFKKAYINTIKKLREDYYLYSDFLDENDVFDWWMSELPKKEYFFEKQRPTKEDWEHEFKGNFNLQSEGRSG